MVLHKGCMNLEPLCRNQQLSDATPFASACQPDVVLSVGESGDGFWSWLRSPALRASLAPLVVTLGAAEPHSRWRWVQGGMLLLCPAPPGVVLRRGGQAPCSTAGGPAPFGGGAAAALPGSQRASTARTLPWPSHGL